jgi:misacylated tRNA(Ala) deacylase
LLPHTEALSRSATTSARLYFFSGPRLIAYLTSSHQLLTNTASVLSCGLPLVPDRVSQTLNDRKKAEKRVTDLENEVARNLVTDLKMELDRSDSLVKYIHRVDDSDNPLTLLSLISTLMANACGSGNKSYLIILTSTPSTQAATTTTIVSVTGTDALRVKAFGEKIKASLGIKGGGQGTRWSGKFTGVWKEDKQGATITELISGTL